jgi:ribosome biogenesis GTPase
VEGLVTLLEANRPTVVGPNGETYLCYLKGRIKRDVGRILVGDRVRFAPTDPGEARIDEVLTRTNQLVRPPVANVAGLFVVFSLARPEGSLELLDKRLVVAQLLGMQAEIIISKVDLVEGDPALEAICDVYRHAGYRVWTVASPDGRGIDELIAPQRSGIWVLTGESGVGKSTLLKKILPLAAAVNTQELSRGGRGQQTTRWVRLYRLGNSWLADSPGYTALEAQASSPAEIRDTFGEFSEYRCRFSNCLHGQEPGCEVARAAERGDIGAWRYQHYRKLVAEWVKTY